jgi:hypothetical protein
MLLRKLLRFGNRQFSHPTEQRQNLGFRSQDPFGPQFQEPPGRPGTEFKLDLQSGRK